MVTTLTLEQKESIFLHSYFAEITTVSEFAYYGSSTTPLILSGFNYGLHFSLFWFSILPLQDFAQISILNLALLCAIFHRLENFKNHFFWGIHNWETKKSAKVKIISGIANGVWIGLLGVPFFCCVNEDEECLCLFTSTDDVKRDLRKLRWNEIHLWMRGAENQWHK